MTVIAVTLLAATAASLPAERHFWVLPQGGAARPAQVEVVATLVRQGQHLAVYLDNAERGVTTEEIDNVVAAFDARVFPQQVATLGPCPDRDANGAVLLVVTPAAGSATFFTPFDAMTEDEAGRYGLRSNQGEVIFTPLRHRGNQGVWNQHAVASAFHQLLHHTHDPAEVAWRHLLGNFAGVAAGVAPVRALWGEADPEGRLHRPEEPWSAWGWPLLFVQYLAEQLGESVPARLATSPLPGLAAVDELLSERGDPRNSLDLLADFAMACWLADPALAAGRFGFRAFVPPRPQPATRLRSSRPISGQIPVGVGGMTFLVVEGTGELALPLALLGEPGLRWTARAVLRRHLGPDREIPVAFDAQGLARVETPALDRGDELVVAVVPGPADHAAPDDRTVLLQVGLGWVPRQAPLESGRTLADLVAAALPAGGAAARTRLSTTLQRLVGQPGGAPAPSRYAWSPSRHDVVTGLVAEAAARNLPARRQSFAVTAPSGAAQEWENVLVELPGADPRRWPVVVAAHWDAVASSLDASVVSATGLHDNASGVAVVLEAAAALARSRHRAPLLFALLAGGHHGAAGARALLDATRGQVAAWVELDGVGIPGVGAERRVVLADVSERPVLLGAAVAAAFRSVGLATRPSARPTARHTGAPLAAARGIPTVVLQAPEGVRDTHTIPVAVEQQFANPDYMLLLAVAVADTASRLAGGP